MVSFASLSIMFIVPALRISTGWSPTWPYVPATELIAAVIAYLGLVIAFYLLASKGKLELAGMATSLLLLFMAFLKPFGFIFLSMLFACVLRDGYPTTVRIDSTHTYTTFGLESLLGGGAYEGCELYENPKSFPFIHRLIKRGVPVRTAAGVEYCPR